MIASGNVDVTPRALDDAKHFFGWGIDEICKAILCLPGSCCYKTEMRFGNPDVWVDYYRADNIKNENIYTHFYVEDGDLIIDSFKDLYKERG